MMDGVGSVLGQSEGVVGPKGAGERVGRGKRGLLLDGLKMFEWSSLQHLCDVSVVEPGCT